MSLFTRFASLEGNTSCIFNKGRLIQMLHLYKCIVSPFFNVNDAVTLHHLLCFGATWCVETFERIYLSLSSSSKITKNSIQISSKM